MNTSLSRYTTYTDRLVEKVELQETESEEDLLDDDEDEDVEEDHDHEAEVPEHAEPVDHKIEAPSAPKEAERQLSKKERRKKELAELEALLADFGVAQNEKGPDELPGNSFASILTMAAVYSYRFSKLIVEVG